MSGPTIRVLALLELLQTHERLTGADLAQRLEVDVRTVRRYISALEQLGIPVTTEQGRYGGYMLVAGFKLPPLMFTDEETLAVSLGLVAARQLGLADSAPAIASVQAKLERVMPDNLKRRVRAISETASIILPQPQPREVNRLALLVLTDAAQEQRCVALTYCTLQGEISEREFDPYGLVYRRGLWYVTGHCHLRNGLRSFRLDRIQDVRLLTDRFRRPADFDAAAYVQQSILQVPRAHPVTLLLHTDIASATNLLGHLEGLFQQRNDGLLMSTTTDSYDWFAWWLVRLPFRFTILEPEPLRDAVRSIADRLLASCESVP